MGRAIISRFTRRECRFCSSLLGFTTIIIDQVMISTKSISVVLTRITDIVSDVAFELAIRKRTTRVCRDRQSRSNSPSIDGIFGREFARTGSDHVTISSVVEGGPAEQGGIRPGDRLKKLGDQTSSHRIGGD